MQASVKLGFGDSDAQLEPPIQQPKVSEDIQQTLSRLLGWNSGTDRFLLVAVDVEGRLLVSQSTTKASTGVITRVTLTGSDQLVLNSNDFRRGFRLLNRGATTVKVAFETPIGTSYFTLDANGTYYDDVYSGNVYLNGTAANVVEVIEL